MLLARRDDGSVRLLQRPASGIWGGLWSPPEFSSWQEVERAVELPMRGALRRMDELRHVFTHFDLVIRPLQLDVGESMSPEWTSGVADSAAKSMWYNPARPEAIGLPAPVSALIHTLIQDVSQP